jgi:hypothetical protein
VSERVSFRMMFKKLVLAACFGLGLSGCQVALPELGMSPKMAQDSVRLSASDFVVSAPDGFCIDAASIKNTPQAGFVLMADCAALRGKKRKVDQSRSLMLTAAISAPLDSVDSVTPKALKQFFDTAQGRTTLSRNGDPSTVFSSMEIMPHDILILHIRDSSPAQIMGLAQDDWRAFVVIKGRLVTLTAAPFVNASVANPSAKTLVTQLARRLQVENATE